MHRRASGDIIKARTTARTSFSAIERFVYEQLELRRQKQSLDIDVDTLALLAVACDFELRRKAEAVLSAAPALPRAS